MARTARIVVPGHPHHVTQRGARRMDVFLTPGDYETYLEMLRHWCEKAGTKVFAYCLMPNHVHLILEPSHEDGLRAALGETHRRYSRHVNSREGWTGHLWQARFSSYPMDEPHLLACAKYVELNPVRAKLVKKPGDWKWSSAKAHLSGKDDSLIHRKPLLALVPSWRKFLNADLDPDALEQIRKHEHSGMPVGSNRYLNRLEKKLGMDVRAKPRGRPRKTAAT
jgi:putative transposase